MEEGKEQATPACSWVENMAVQTGMKPSQTVTVLNILVVYKRKHFKENNGEQLKSSTSTGAKCSCSNEMHTGVPRRLISCSPMGGRQPFKQLFTSGKSVSLSYANTPNLHSDTGKKQLKVKSEWSWQPKSIPFSLLSWGQGKSSCCLLAGSLWHSQNQE